MVYLVRIDLITVLGPLFCDLAIFFCKYKNDKTSK